LTAEGFRPYPLVNEIRKYLQGKSVEFPQIGPDSNMSYPTLVTATWCPYTLPSIQFWKDTASEVGVSLNVLYAETEEGNRMIVSADVAGVPCLVANPKTLFYGLMISRPEAFSFLKKACT
jgi:hypothetical protein